MMLFDVAKADAVDAAPQEELEQRRASAAA
jgi:hypothetical protein